MKEYEHSDTINIEETEQKNTRKVAVIFMLCLMSILLILLGLSRGQYKTPVMRGNTQYDAALFNTVLLGSLTQTDVTALASVTSETYTVKNAKGETKQQTVSGEKLSKSLNLSLGNEIGATSSTGSLVGIKPGAVISIPFTVTNGTTVSGTVAGENQENEEQGKIANVAETDIRYTLHIITTHNLPFVLQLRDVLTNTTYELDTKTETNEEVGAAKDYTVRDNDTTFIDGSRILKWTGDDSITVHRYELVATWPSTGKTEQNGEDVSNTDIRYMKEIDNIEVRLEVESFVNNIQKIGSSDMVASGVLTLQDSDTDPYYTVNAVGMGTIYRQKLVRYDNFGNTQTEGSYEYDFSICNGDRTVVWDDANKKYTFAAGNFKAYSGLSVAIAVPGGGAGVGSAMYDCTYKIEYNGVEYTGTWDGESVTNTTVRKKVQKEGSSAAYPQYEYRDVTEVAYKILKFRDASGNLLTLDAFAEGTFSSQDLTLKMSGADDKYTYHDTEKKDDFRIYVYQPN